MQSVLHVDMDKSMKVLGLRKSATNYAQLWLQWLRTNENLIYEMVWTLNVNHLPASCLNIKN